MTVVNHKAYLDELISALGYDPELVDEHYDEIIGAAKVLNKVRVALMTSHPEKTRALFICGISDAHDATGFPDSLTTCIEFGSNVVARYERKEVGGHG